MEELPAVVELEVAGTERGQKAEAMVAVAMVEESMAEEHLVVAVWVVE